VQRTRAGFRLALTDSAPKADSTFGIFPPIPALAANACRWAAFYTMKRNKFMQSSPQFIATHANIIAWANFFICTLNFIVQRNDLSGQLELEPSLVIFSILCVSMPLIIGFISKKQDDLSPIVQEILINDKQQNEISNWYKYINWDSYWSYSSPMIVGVLGLITMLVLGIPWKGLALITFIITAIIFLVNLGSLSWCYASMLLWLWKITTKSTPKVEPFMSSVIGLKKLNNKFLMIFSTGIIIYIFAIVGVWILPFGTWFLLSTKLGQWWIFPLAIVITGYFIASQYMFHVFMKKIKYQRLQELDFLLNKLMKRWLFNSDKDFGYIGFSAIDQQTVHGKAGHHSLSPRLSTVSAEFPNNQNYAEIVSELLKWRSIIDGEAESPLNFATSVAIIGSLIMPTIQTIINLFIK